MARHTRLLVVCLLLALALGADPALSGGKGKDSGSGGKGKSNKGKGKGRKVELDACEVCEGLVTKFEKGIERTSKGGSQGGDVDWEERKGFTYKTSEVRLVEILGDDGLCGKKYACSELLERHEEAIEEWWFKHQNDRDLRTHLCVHTAGSCCPRGRWGPDCQPCPGGAEQPCNGRGSCSGSGKKAGKGGAEVSGKCTCDVGYQGLECNDCAHSYFRRADASAGGAMECVRCDSACIGCDGSTAAHCAECAFNHFRVAADSGAPNAGHCVACDVSCSACTGPGPEDCVACGTGYFRSGGGSGDGDAPCQPCACNGHSSSCNRDTGACYSCTGHTEGVNCEKCLGGYELAEEGGEDAADDAAEGGNTHRCVDIDECAVAPAADEEAQALPPACPAREVCVNTMGSFRCDCEGGMERVDGACPGDGWLERVVRYVKELLFAPEVPVAEPREEL